MHDTIVLDPFKRVILSAKGNGIYKWRRTPAIRPQGMTGVLLEEAFSEGHSYPLQTAPRAFLGLRTH